MAAPQAPGQRFGKAASGPLTGVRVVELAGIGPCPFAGMMLADAGADVIRVDRVAHARRAAAGVAGDVLRRGRRSVAVDLKHAEGVAVVLRLVETADALIEGFRPGVCERLGIGPSDCLTSNPRLVYGRVTGWGRQGPLAERAGHDLDYLAQASSLAKAHNLATHLDGARVFNAAVKLGVDVKEITQHVDSISCCLSKGLAAPVGSGDANMTPSLHVA